MPSPASTPDFNDLSDSQKMLIVSLAINDMQSNIERYNKILITGDNGGQLPLLERVRNLETYINGMKSSMKFWGRTIGAALLVQTLTFLAGIIIALVRFLPVLENLSKSRTP